ncbi:unnamed protein product [Lactuca saligna]|uniref:Uncharacterized protein n=1 Tax=Lactuca saligna TaxID=75948 RepID=A0AA35UTU8_LACSI|nr:unnamed protein product [Lactuca saligna]
MWRQDFAHEEHCWITDSMDGVKQRLGMDHPPFLQAVPTVPPPPSLTTGYWSRRCCTTMPPQEYSYKQRPRITEPDKSEPTLHDVMRRQDFAHEEHCWIIHSMDGVKQRLGMDHPPFLQAVPTVPPAP